MREVIEHSQSAPAAEADRAAAGAAGIVPHTAPAPASGIAVGGDVVDVERREFLWHVHEYTNEHIRFADTKAGAVIVFCSALLGVLYGQGMHHALLERGFGEWGLAMWLAAIAFLFLAGGALFAAWSIFPRLTNPQPKGFIFWESVRAHPDGECFADAVAAESPEELGRHLAAHLRALAGIATRKFWWVQMSVGLAIVGAVAAAMSLLLQ